MITKRILGFAIALLLISCGGSKKVTESAIESAAKTKIIKSHNAAAIEFKTLQSRLGVNYQDPDKSQSVTVDLRMEKGKQIWMSARILGFTMAKVYITPDRVQFYEKLQKRSFDGDFSLISDFLGEELTFEQLENLLLGQVIEPINDMDYTVVNNRYEFRKAGVIEKLFALRPSDFKVDQQSIIKKSENTTLDVRYLEYQTVSGKLLPADISINANSNGKLVQVELQMNNVEFDQELSFPFDMPSNYKTMTF
jgi:outer membrane biogenesis lipoprotein LolB